MDVVILIGCSDWSDFRHGPARFCAVNEKKFNADLEQPESEVAEAHYALQYVTVTNCKIVDFL